ncbi:hypothetical protein [Pontibacter burrus]|nr:hypothetical protein [Pontibacter burrus]
MRNYSIACIVMAVVALVACEQPAPHAASASNFNVAAYVQQEAKRLQAAQPAILKTVKTEHAPTETIQLNHVNWGDELAVFEDADITKPTLQEYYSRQEQELPDGSKAVSYQRIPDAKAPVSRLLLQISPSGNLQRLEATMHDENLLFYSERNAILEANPQNGHLQSYRINGVQKLIFSDSLHYSIHVNL